jgi:signal transduction histidine kinase
MVSNSLKFTKKGVIIITVTIYKFYVGIIVQDSGSGIKKENLKLIGDEFETFNNEFNENDQGTGIGLALSKRLISQLGP